MRVHIYDNKTLVCSCGRTFEQHLNIALVTEKIREKWFNGNVDLENDFKEIDKVKARTLIY